METLLIEAAIASAAPAAPPPEFLERCRTVGRQAAELQRLRAARPLAASPWVPLREHCRLLATLAQVQLAAFVANLSSATRRGGALTPWIRLGQLLGLPTDEMRRRVRLEFLPRRVLASLDAQPSMSLGRSRPRSAPRPEGLEHRLAEQEAAYSPRRGRDLTRALATMDAVYGHDRN